MREARRFHNAEASNPDFRIGEGFAVTRHSVPYFYVC
jgi:hypothetical protein